MISSRHLGLLVLAPLALAACPKNDPPPSVAVDVFQPEAPAALADAASEPLSPLPERFAALGGPCPADASGHAGWALCDEQGRVAGVWSPVDMVGGVPPERAEVVRVEPRREHAPGRSLVVALEGPRLWVRLVSCGACRRVMGWSFVGELSRLSDEQLLAVQRRVGLPDSVQPLRSSQAWREAYRDRPLPSLPEGAVPISKPYAAPPGIPGECMNRPPHEPVPPQCQNLK